MLAYTVRHDGQQWSSGWDHHPDPRPSPGEVVVEVSAAALAWSDVLQAEGRYAGALPDPPFVGGHEFAGEVVEAPRGTGFEPGDRVFGFLPSAGAFSEYLCAPVAYLQRTPDGVDDVTAAAATSSFLTADVALVGVGRMTPECTVVVHAGAGGVGSAAVQLASHYGAAQLIATAGTPERRAHVVAIGADECADYSDFAEVVARRTNGRGADLVLESVGGKVFDDSARLLAPMGRLVTIGASSGEPPARLKLPLLWQRSISVCGLHIGRLLMEAPALITSAWARVLPLLAERVVTVNVAMTVAPSEIEAGMRTLTTRSVLGRVVVDFRGSNPRRDDVLARVEGREGTRQ